MTQVTINGHVYSDDGSAARDMLNGGSRNWLLPMLSDTMQAVAGVDAAADAAEASAAAAAASAAALVGTSSTSLAIGLGSKSLTTQAGKKFTAGTFLLLVRQGDANAFMYGRATAYDSSTGALTVNVLYTEGSGTFTDWSISLSGVRGAAGPAGSVVIGKRTLSGTDTVGASDASKLLTISGMSTLSTAGAATLGASFCAVLKNSAASGFTTLQAASGTIDGQATRKLYAGEVCLLMSDGSAITTQTIERGAAGMLVVQSRAATGAAPTQSVSGGTSATVAFNTVVTNTLDGASMASNVISLPAGTYKAKFFAPSFQIRTSLRNSADSSLLVPGTYYVDSTAFEGVFSLATAGSVIVSAYSNTASGSSSSLGNTNLNTGDPNIGASLIIERIG